MDKFPIYHTPATISSKAPAVPVRIDPTTGGQELAKSFSALGEGLLDLGTMIQGKRERKNAIAQAAAKKEHLEQMKYITGIAEERQKLYDLKNSIKIEKVLGVAFLNNMDFRDTTGDSASWEKNFNQEVKSALVEIDELTMGMSAETVQVLNERLQAKIDDEYGRLIIASTKREKSDTMDMVKVQAIDTFASGDELLIPKAKQDFDEGYARFTTPELAQQAWRDIEAAGLKMRNENAVKAWKDSIALNPLAVETLRTELRERETKEGFIPEKDLTNSDIQELIGYSGKIQGEVKSVIASDILEQMEKSENLDYAAKDKLTSELRTIVWQSNYTDTEKRVWTDYINDWANGKDIKSDLDVLNELDTKVRNPEGYGGIAKIEEEIHQNIKKLSRLDIEQLRNKLKTETDQSDNINLQNAYDYLYGQIVGDTGILLPASGVAKMKYQQAKNELYQYYIIHKDTGFRGQKIFDYTVNKLAKKPEYQMDITEMFIQNMNRLKETGQKIKEAKKQSRNKTDDKSMLDTILGK